MKEIGLRMPTNSVINIKKSDIEIEFYRSSGHGGQHKNKTATAVRIRHIPTGIVAQASERRSQHLNREIAMQRLENAIARLLFKPKKRIPTKTTESQKRKRLEEKKKLAKKKALRRIAEGGEGEEKKSEVAPTVEAIPAEFAEAYKNVVVVSEIEGVDWQKGTITAIGRGYPPKDITNPAQIRILTMRAAKVEGYKALLETILKMKTPPDRGMKEYLDEKHIEMTRIEGFVKGAMVVKEEYKDDRSAEVTLEVPITGGSGLVAVLK